MGQLRACRRRGSTAANHPQPGAPCPMLTKELQETLKREMLTMHLRQPCQHPLFGPELAYAFVLR